MKFFLLALVFTFVNKSDSITCTSKIIDILNEADKFENPENMAIDEKIKILNQAKAMCRKAKFSRSKLYVEIPSCKFDKGPYLIEEAKVKAVNLQRKWCKLSSKV